MDSIQTHNLLEANPIIVNENMEVLDGQHRLEVAKRLQVPIYYIVMNEVFIEDVARLNSTQKNWKLEHFLEVFANQCHKEEYVKLYRWLKEHKFRLSQGLSFFLEEGKVALFRQTFKDGDFKFLETNAKYADFYQEITRKIISMKGGITRPWMQQSFVRAFLLFMQNSEVDSNRFRQQLEKYSFLVNPMPTKQLYLEMFYHLYNYNKTKKITPMSMNEEIDRDI